MRPYQWFFAAFSFFLVAIAYQAYKAHGTMSSLRAQEVSVDKELANANAEIRSIPVQSVSVAKKRERLNDVEATSSFTEIQASLGSYLDTLAREDNIRIAPSTCAASPTEDTQPGLEGLKCTFNSTGTWTSILDSTSRLSSYAPVVVYVTDVSLQRNVVGDGSTNPTLAAKTTFYLERVEPQRAPASTAAPTASPSSSATPAPGAAS